METGARPAVTLADALARRQDNFLLLRWLAASLVIYGHGPALSGGSGWPDLFLWLGWGDYSGNLAVDVFFVISGYMIAGSYLRRAHLGDFLWARVLRIYPAYIVCLLLCAFVLGTAFTVMPWKAYLAHHDVIHYVSKNIELGKGLAWYLPGVFADNPLPGVINGSIWTLPAEIRMYLWVGAIGLLGILSRRWLCNLVLAALFAWGLYDSARIPLLPLDSFVHLAAYFALGAFCFVNRHWLRFGWRWVIGFGLLAWALHATAFYPFAFGLALTSFVFAFAYATPWYGFNRLGDYSYGLYLWGYPAQQVVAHIAPGLAPVVNALLAWCMAMLAAVVSWHAIERPAMALKSVPAALYARVKLRWVRARGAA